MDYLQEEQIERLDDVIIELDKQMGALDARMFEKQTVNGDTIYVETEQAAALEPEFEALGRKMSLCEELIDFVRSPIPDQQFTVTVGGEQLGRLLALVAADDCFNTVDDFLATLLDHVDQGIYRPGSWERGWLEKAVHFESVEAAEDAFPDVRIREVMAQ